MSAPTNVSTSAVFQMTAQRYSGAAAISLVVYDILVTLDNEIEYFWGRSFSLVQLIYFLNRYYGLVVVVIYLYGDMIQDVSGDLCKRIVQFGAWSGWTMILLADATMAIRVHALFERTKMMTVFLGALYLVQGLAMMGILIGYDQKFNDFSWPSLRACGAIAPAWSSFFWFVIPTLVFEFILLCMTLYKAILYDCQTVSRGTRNYHRYNLHHILVRDQIIYFASILFSGCMNIVLWEQLADGSPNNEGITLSAAIPCVLGGRILIGLREVAARQDDIFTEEDADTSTLVL